MSNTILFNEETNVIEVRYEGVNADLLASMNVRLTNLENSFASAIGGVNGQLGSLTDDVASLESLYIVQAAALIEETNSRISGDTTLNENFANEIIDVTADYINRIEDEAETRAAAILNEASERGAAIAASEAIIMTDVATLATSVSGLAAQMGAAEASIIEVSDALVTETAARTAQYTLLQADYGDTSAAVLEEVTARADADGSISAKYSVKVDVNGHVAGFGLISEANDGAVVSQFIVNADYFKIYNGTSAIAPFSVSGGVVTMTNVNVTASLDITNTVQTFTPTWTGFSTSPTGDMSYIDLGALVLMWWPNTSSGTSNAGTMSITNVPTAARPASVRAISCLVLDFLVTKHGGAFVDSGGNLNFFNNNGSGALHPTGGFDTTNVGKGLPQGFMIIYAK